MVSIEQDIDSHRFIIQNDGALLDRFKRKFSTSYRNEENSIKSGIGAYSAFIIAKTHGGNVSFIDSGDKVPHLTVEIPKKLPSMYS
jgi:hypothetical protein